MTNRVVYYSPAAFPDILTDATLLDSDGELLLISNGWQTKLISWQQVERTASARAHEGSELLADEMQEFDRLAKGI